MAEDFEAIGYEPPPPATFNQHWLRAPEGRRVTLVVTSCGRLPGLRRTIASFLAANTYPIDRYLIMEDSGDVRMAGRVIEELVELSPSTWLPMVPVVGLIEYIKLQS